MSRLNRLNISTIKRTARKRGPLSSDAWNDSFEELVADLTNLYNEWNNYLQPLTVTIPDGTDDVDVDAFENGLDGQNLYTDAGATEDDLIYYSSGDSRPVTIYEQFADLYTQLDTLEENLAAQIGTQIFSASNISIDDSGSYFTGSTVENALQEVGSDLATHTHATAPNEITFAGGNKLIVGGVVPEGAVAAAMGSLYLNTAGGASTTLYVKESGSGNTGWIAK